MIKNKIPELMKERGINASELMRGIEVTYVTAHKLATGKETKGITYEMLNKLCKFFNVGVDEILEYEPD
jgi:DNA-binding Xre family transcriptional regulator